MALASVFCFWHSLERVGQSAEKIEEGIFLVFWNLTMKNVFQRMARCGTAAYLYAVPVLVWMGVIFLLSSQPSLGVSGQHISLSYLLVRKGAHVAEYFFLGFLSFRLFRFCFSGNAHAVAAGVILLTLPFALSDEAHQLFVTGRQGRISDVLIDAFGIGLSLFFCLVILRRWKERREKLEE